MQKFSSKNVTNGIYEEVLKLINKYVVKSDAITNFMQLGEESNKPQGFYLMFLKRDETLPIEDRLLITTFGQNMPIDDLVSSFENIILEVLENSKKKTEYYA